MKAYFLPLLLLGLHTVGGAYAQSFIQADTTHQAARYIHTVPRETYLQPAYDDKILVYGYNALVDGYPTPYNFTMFNGWGKPVSGFSPAYMLSRGNSPILHNAPGKYILYTPNTNSGTSTSRRILLERLDTLGQPDAASFQIWGASPNTGFIREDYTRLIVQQDGRILIASNQDSVNGYYSPFLARILSNGRIDSSFRSRFTGVRPNTLPSVARVRQLYQFSNGNLALSFEGEYVYAGIRYDGHPLESPGGYNSFPVMFLRPDGSLIGFLHDSAYSLNVSNAGSLGNHLYYTGYDYRDKTAILRRCETTGAVDASFGSIRIQGINGASLKICGFLPDSSFIIRSDSGRGDGFDLQYSGRYGYAHIFQDGSVDRNFRLPSYLAYMNTFLKMDSDRLFVAGMSAPSPEGVPPSGILVLDGRLGLLAQQASTFSLPAACERLLPDATGKYYAVGGFGVNDRNFPLLQRYFPDGRLDTSFRVRTPVRFTKVSTYGLTGRPTSALIRRDGRLIVAGSFAYTYRGREVYGQMALLPDGSLDTSYHTVALMLAGFVAEQGGVSNIAEDSLGRVYLSGYFNRVNGLVRRGFVRLLPNGDLDPSFLGPDSVELYPSISFPMHILPEGGFLTSARVYHRGRFYSGLCRFSQDGRYDSTYQGISLFANAQFSAAKFIPAADGSIDVLGGGYLEGRYGQLLPAVRLLPGTRQVDTVWTRRLWLSSQQHVRLLPNQYYISGGTRLPDRSLIATGELAYPNQTLYPPRSYSWIKILADGTIDTTLAADSSIVNRAKAQDALLLADGNLLLAGEFYFDKGRNPDVAANRTLMVYRLGLMPTNSSQAAYRNLLTVSPNPAHTSLTIQGLTDGSASTLQDLTGHTVRTCTSSTISLQGLAPGLYVLRAKGYAPARVVVE